MKLPVIYIHILLVIIFLLIPILSSPDLDSRFSMLRVSAFQQEMLQTCLLIVFFYFNFLFLIPRFFNRKQYFVYFISVFLCFATIAILPQSVMGNRTGEFWTNTLRTLLPFLFSFLSSFFWYKSIEQQELERAKTNAELLNLKYQLQPHFLFNTLNSIYSLSLLKSDDASSSILKLSNAMRYIVQESDAELVDLEKEIQYLKDYIALQLIRTDESLDFSYTETGNPKGKKIAPLILVNFIENAFKYGFNAEENSKISIEIIVAENLLCLNVYNYIVNKTASRNGSAIGIKNTLERLKYIYPNQHEIEINNNQSYYEVRLKINLHKEVSAT